MGGGAAGEGPTPGDKVALATGTAVGGLTPGGKVGYVGGGAPGGRPWTVTSGTPTHASLETEAPRSLAAKTR